MIFKIFFAVLYFQNVVQSAIIRHPRANKNEFSESRVEAKGRTGSNYKLTQDNDSDDQEQLEGDGYSFLKGLKETILENLPPTFNSNIKEDDERLRSETRRLGSNIISKFSRSFNLENDDKSLYGKGVKTNDKVKSEDIVRYLQEGYTKVNQLLEDKDVKVWMENISKADMKEWLNNLYINVKKAMVRYAVSSQVDSSPLITPVDKVLKMIAPLTGDTSSSSIVYRVLDFVTK